MKKYYFLLLTVLALSSNSCSKDDTPDKDESAALSGEWELVEFRYEGTTTVKRGDMFDESSYIGTAKDIDVQMLINKLPNNTWETGGSYSFELVSTVNGEVQTTEEPYSDVSSSGSYTVNGEILRLGYDKHDGALAIKEASITRLTEGELVLEFEYSETSEVNGFEVELVVQGVQRFSR